MLYRCMTIYHDKRVIRLLCTLLLKYLITQGLELSYSHTENVAHFFLTFCFHISLHSQVTNTRAENTKPCVSLIMSCAEPVWQCQLIYHHQRKRVRCG